MSYQSIAIWVYCAMLLIFFMLSLSTQGWVFGLAFFAVPCLILWQAVSILKADDPSPAEFEDEWYEHK